MEEDRIYVIGGLADGQCSVETFKISDNAWYYRAPLNSWRFDVCIAELNGYIYAVGGGYGSEHINIVERYDPAKDAWKKCRSWSLLILWTDLDISNRSETRIDINTKLPTPSDPIRC